MSLNTNASETSFASEQSCAKLSFNIIAFNRYSASKSLHLPIQPTTKPTFGNFNSNISAGMVRPM